MKQYTEFRRLFCFCLSKSSFPPLQNFFLPPAKVYPKAWDEYSKAWDKYPKAWDEYPKLWDVEIWRVLLTFIAGFGNFYGRGSFRCCLTYS